MSERPAFTSEICLSNRRETDSAAKNQVNRAGDEWVRRENQRRMWGQEVAAEGDEREETRFRGIGE